MKTEIIPNTNHNLRLFVIDDWFNLQYLLDRIETHESLKDAEENAYEHEPQTR